MLSGVRAWTRPTLGGGLVLPQVCWPARPTNLNLGRSLCQCPRPGYGVRSLNGRSPPLLPPMAAGEVLSGDGEGRPRMDWLGQSFDQYTVVWLLITSIIGGIVGASIKFLFEGLLTPRVTSKRDTRRLVRPYTVPCSGRRRLWSVGSTTLFETMQRVPLSKLGILSHEHLV